jgi:hypothetical protein
MIMAFFIIFSYATIFFNILSQGQLEGVAVTPAVVMLRLSRNYLKALHSSEIFFNDLAMIWNCQASKLCNLLQQLRVWIVNGVDSIRRVEADLMSVV